MLKHFSLRVLDCGCASAHDVPMQKAEESTPAQVSRRTALKAIGAGIGTVAALPWLSDEGLIAFARIQETNAPPQLKLLSPSQFATLEVRVDAIIPTDDRSPGAKQARVADYIDLLLSEVDRETRSSGSAASRRSTRRRRHDSARRSAALAPVRSTRFCSASAATSARRRRRSRPSS